MRPAISVNGSRRQSSLFGTSLILPRDEITGVHVGRRDRGTYDVLIQRGDELVPVAITKGRESKALALKMKIERLLNIAPETKM